MQRIAIGDVSITSIIERDGPWRTPEAMFPGYDPVLGREHLATLDPVVFDPASGKMVITYQTFVVRTPKHTILVDTCTGEDKGHPPPFDFPGKERWRKELFALGVSVTVSSSEKSSSTSSAWPASTIGRQFMVQTAPGGCSPRVVAASQ